MLDKSDKCGTCLFFVQTDDIRGDCRRRSPSINEVVITMTDGRGQYHKDGRWPNVSLRDCCGEYAFDMEKVT